MNNRARDNERYYKKHKEVLLKRALEYQKLHKEEVNERHRKWYKKNAKKLGEQKKAWRAKNPKKVIGIKLKNRYGITIEQFEEMLIKQNGLCAICNNLPEEGKRLNVDHDHKTNKVRALLCRNCNLLIGHANDQINLL